MVGMKMTSRILSSLVVRDYYRMALDECFDAVHTGHFLHFGGEGLRTAVTFDRGEPFHFECLHLSDLFGIAPPFVDRRQFPLVPQDQREYEQHDRQYAGQPAQRLFAADLQGAFRTTRYAIAAQRAVDVPDGFQLLQIDVIGTFFRTGAAAVAALRVADDAQQREYFATQVDHFVQVADQAGCAQRPYPCRRKPGPSEQPEQQEEPHERDREFENIAQRSERADVFAPEHFDEETAEEQQHDRDAGHPGRDFTLETGRHCVVRVEILAEQLARRDRHVEYHEQQSVFDDPQSPIGDAARFQVEVHFQLAAAFAEVFPDCPQRTQITAEQLAEQDDAHGQYDSHHDLRHRHAACQRIVMQVTADSLQASERAVGFRIGALFSEKDPIENKCHDRQQRAALQRKFQPVAFF